MTSRGGDILFEPGSIAVMKRVRQARASGMPLFFTLDAGPNVHLLYPHPAADRVEEFIRQELAPLCEEGKVIFDKRGEGPCVIDKLEL
jgi:diphosphomevalonate decarboxylase